MILKNADLYNFYFSRMLTGSTQQNFSKYKATDGTVALSSVTPSSSYRPTTPLVIRKASNGFNYTDVEQTLNTALVSYAPSASYTSSNTLSSNCDIIIGDGATPVTENDYKIENQVFLTVSGITATTDVEGNFVNIKTYTNTGDAYVTIKEIGLLVGSPGYVFSNNSSSKPVLVYREVLDTPIVVNSGDSINVILKQGKISIE